MAYETVRELVPTLWDGRKVDFALHIGMAAGRQFYSVERRGHRDGYAMKDVDNELLGDGARRAREKENWIWAGMPEELLTSVDIDDVGKRWRAALPVRLVFKRRLIRADASSRIAMYESLRMLDDTFATSSISRAWRI